METIDIFHIIVNLKKIQQVFKQFRLFNLFTSVGDEQFLGVNENFK